MIQFKWKDKSLDTQIKGLAKIYRKKPKSKVFFPLADAYMKAGKIDMAEEIVRKGLSSNPRYWAAKALLGEILYKKGDFEQAKEELEAVMQKVPENMKANRLLHIIYREIGLDKASSQILPILKILEESGRIPCNQKKEADELNQSYLINSSHKEKGENPSIEQDKTEGRLIDLIDIMEGKVEEDSRLQSSPTPETAPQLKDVENITQDQDLDDLYILEMHQEDSRQEIVTATLAELYVKQGLFEKSMDIYKKLLLQQPERKDWLKRMKDIQRIYAQKTATDSNPQAFPQSLPDQRSKEEVIQNLENWMNNCQKIKIERGL